MRKGFIQHTLEYFGYRKHAPVKAGRSYTGGIANRLTADWNPGNNTADSEIRSNLPLLRARCRQMERDNDYVRRYLSALENNVLGADGISLQMKVSEMVNTKQGPRKQLDQYANVIIEEAWKTWCKKKYCTLEGEDSWVDVQKLILRSTARDGGILIQKIPVGDRNQNPFGFTLRLIEVDYLDYHFTGTFANGNYVVMGVEKNQNRQTVAFWVLGRHPGENLSVERSQQHRIRIPADQIIHYFVKERTTQSVGVPWICSPITRLHHMEQYELAEMMAARKGAEKGGYFQSETGQTFTGPTEGEEDGENGTQASASVLNDFEPMSFDELPPGMKFVEYNPTHPNQAYGDFIKASLYGIAAGMDIDYSTLTGDLSQANYSSMRSGKLESQETWKKIQGHLITHVCLEVFEAWLDMALLTGAITLPYAKKDKFNSPLFRGRRWPWVDPEKDIRAALMAIDGGLDTRSNVIGQNGGDFEDVTDELTYEKAMAEEKGLEFVTPNSQPKVEGPSETVSEIEEVKALADAYGVGVRAGTITPNDEDEAFFRSRLQLPAANKNVAKAWSEDDGIRRPITLVQKVDGAAVQPGAAPKAAPKTEGEE